MVANLPYYITADILLRLVTAKHAPESIAIMVQKEAAERVMSSPGTKAWCALAATVQSYGAAEVLLDVPSEAFNPPPHVQSQFIIIRKHGVPIVTPKDERLYLRVINAAFGLDQAAAVSALEVAGLDARVRGEALSLQELSRLSDVLCDLTAGRFAPG